MAEETLYILEQNVREPKAVLAAELRIRMDNLGLTSRGKRALRWRVRGKAEVLDFSVPKLRSTTRRLRAVDPQMDDPA